MKKNFNIKTASRKKSTNPHSHQLSESGLSRKSTASGLIASSAKMQSQLSRDGAEENFFHQPIEEYNSYASKEKSERNLLDRVKRLTEKARSRVATFREIEGDNSTGGSGGTFITNVDVTREARVNATSVLAFDNFKENASNGNFKLTNEKVEANLHKFLTDMVS